jgi:lysyl-tRNA synthetase class 2
MRGKQDHSRERELRRNRTEAERHLWESLRNRRLAGFRFRRQHRVGPYYADFSCIESLLIVELDGSQHLQHAGHDAVRTAYLGRQGYRVLRFWNDDALVRTSEVLDAILAALRTPHPAALRAAVPLPAPRGEGKAIPPACGEGHAVPSPACGKGKATPSPACGKGEAVPSPRLRGEGAEGG